MGKYQCYPQELNNQEMLWSKTEVTPHATIVAYNDYHQDAIIAGCLVVLKGRVLLQGHVQQVPQFSKS